MHISSLPGPFGIGVFGEEAVEFAKKLDADGTVKGCADEVLKTLDLDARESMDKINYGRFIRKGWELTV